MIVVWGERVLSELIDITEYVAEDNRSASLTMFRRFKEAAKRVGTFPLSGRLVPEYNNDNIREVIVGSYRLLYIVLIDRVEIHKVIHGARMLDSANDDEDK